MTNTSKSPVEQQEKATEVTPDVVAGKETRGQLADTLGGEEIVWSNEMGSRSRSAWLLLVKGDEIIPFNEEGIPGVAVVKGTDYTKNGKWSHTTYRIVTAPGVRAISGLNGWETGRFVEGLRSAAKAINPIDTWSDVAQALGVSVPNAMTFLRNWRPKAADALDKVDAQLDTLDDEADRAEALQETESVVVSFGSPTRRMRADGFWESPKDIPGHEGEVQLIDPTKGWNKENVRVSGMIGTVLSVTHASGHGDGYVSMTVAVVPGSSSKVDKLKEPSVSEAEVAQPSTSKNEPKSQTPAGGWTVEDLKKKFGSK